MAWTDCFWTQPAVALKLFGFIRAVEKSALEKLHGHHGEDEHEEHVDDQDVQHVLQRVDDTVKYSLRDTNGNIYKHTSALFALHR